MCRVQPALAKDGRRSWRASYQVAHRTALLMRWMSGSSRCRHSYYFLHRMLYTQVLYVLVLLGLFIDIFCGVTVRRMTKDRKFQSNARRPRLLFVSWSNYLTSSLKPGHCYDSILTRSKGPNFELLATSSLLCGSWVIFVVGQRKCPWL